MVPSQRAIECFTGPNVYVELLKVTDCSSDMLEVPLVLILWRLHLSAIISVYKRLHYLKLVLFKFHFQII